MHADDARGDAGLAWLTDLLGEGTADAALSAYEESCAAVKADVGGTEPDATALARWMALLSLGSRGMGEILERSSAANAAGDMARVSHLAEVGQRLQAASRQLV
ncbi:MAG: hypothetical protein U1E65_00445 [Myxococcota bacterium]